MRSKSPWPPPLSPPIGAAILGKGCRLIAMTAALVTLYSLSTMIGYSRDDDRAAAAAAVRVVRDRRADGVVREERRAERSERPIGWIDRLATTEQAVADNELVDLNDFAYVMEPRRPCSTNGGRHLHFLVYVHSAPDHFEARQIIRSTWGSPPHDLDFGMRLVFLVGAHDGGHRLQTKLVEEHALYDDLVQGNFADTYRNLTYKHLMGYKWTTTRCPSATLIVKADDDAFVDVIQLRRVLDRIYGQTTKETLVIDAIACSMWPEASSRPQRHSGAKWAVSRADYPYDTYPAYCGGLAYVVSPDVARDLLSAARLVPFFWIDDVYVTGLLVEALRDAPRRQALNLRTTYDTAALLAWLRDATDRRPCPYVFGDVSDSGDGRARVVHRLWQKTVDFWRRHDASSPPSSPPLRPPSSTTSSTTSQQPSLWTIAAERQVLQSSTKS